MSRATLIVLACLAFIGLTLGGMFYSISRFQAQSPVVGPASWLGDWTTVTCHAGDSIPWRVRFREGPTGMRATYQGTASPVDGITGSLAGKTTGPVFAGRWTQDNAPQNTGRITLEVFERGTLFAGTYVNEATGEENRWLGRRNGVPECD